MVGNIVLEEAQISAQRWFHRQLMYLILGEAFSNLVDAWHHDLQKVPKEAISCRAFTKHSSQETGATSQPRDKTCGKEYLRLVV